MAPTSHSLWSEQGTTPDAIEEALRQMLAERHAENGGYVPARVLNMLAFVESAWSGEISNRLRGVERYHASRLIVLSYTPGRERLDARATVAAEGDPTPGQLALLRETVVVELGDVHMDDLPTIAAPLLVSDLPTLLWSPHGNGEVVEALLGLAQSVLIDSVDEPDCKGALRLACGLVDRSYVVDLAWLRSTPWRERIAAAFDPPAMRSELSKITALQIRHHPQSGIAALLLCGWLASRLGWRGSPLVEHGSGRAGRARSRRGEISLSLTPSPEQQVRGLAGITLQTASGLCIALDRGVGGLRTRRRSPRGDERAWTILGASRGESGILGEGIRQSLLRDPAYQPALRAAWALCA
jgi:glucose-6-phosphate dehydrogenase assembly protein OpcA